MPDEHKTDLVMKFATKDGDVDAECALDKNADDTFMKDFSPATYDSFSNFFELSKFSFGFEVRDKAESKQGPGVQAGGHGGKQSSNTQGSLSAVQGDFASWRALTDTEALAEDQSKKLQLQFESFRFDRLIDSASPIFFQYCVDSKSFASAVMVKRVQVGGDATSPTMGYIRMEFKDVLITSVSWDDGDMTTEKCEFICREYVLRYRRQKPDGSLEKEVSQVTWKSKDDDTT